mgnify:FL=1
MYNQLLSKQNKNQALILSKFFKTNPGEYGENDCFLGIKVPIIRDIVKSTPLMSIEQLEPLISSKWHEVRMASLFMLIRIFKNQFSKQKKRKDPEYNFQNPCLDFYLNHTQYINNWDLVDLSCPTIIGEWLYYLKSQKQEIIPILKKLAKSNNIWEKRMSIVSTLYFVKHNDFEPTLEIIEENLFHNHDLIHKANGWLLREIGKKNLDIEEQFLKNNDLYKKLPRTTLRYAIEKFEETKRQSYLKSTI